MDIDKLTEKERDALLIKLSAKKKQDAINRKRNYQKARARFITSVERRLRKYVKDGQAFKEWLRVEAETYYNMLKDYGELKRDEQLGFTVNSETFRIQVKGNRVKRFD